MMPPFIYPHRANGRGGIPVTRHYKCRKLLCGHYRSVTSTSRRDIPECPEHKIPMRRA